MSGKKGKRTRVLKGALVASTNSTTYIISKRLNVEVVYQEITYKTIKRNIISTK